MQRLTGWSVTAVALALGACGQATTGEADAPPRNGADIVMTPVAGVAYSHAYTLRLPPARIAAVQERHAAACERLGAARCRISGFDYAVSDQGHVTANLAFRLAPALARGFAREGIAQVVAADGMLTRASISSVDAGAELAAAQEEAAITSDDAEVAGAEAGAATTGGERTAARAARTKARQATRAARDTIRAQQALLAFTPVTFEYEPGQRIARFAGDGPLSGVLDLSLWVVQAVIRIIAVLVAVLLPFAVIAGVAWLAVRAFRRRWPRAGVAPPDAP